MDVELHVIAHDKLIIHSGLTEVESNLLGYISPLNCADVHVHRAQDSAVENWMSWIFQSNETGSQVAGSLVGGDLEAHSISTVEKLMQVPLLRRSFLH